MRNFQAISVIKTVLVRPRIIFIGAIIQLAVLSVLSNPVAIPTPTQQAVDYHSISNIVWAANQILTLLLPTAFLIFGIGTRISNKTLKYGKYLTFTILAIVFFILNWLIQLPLERIRTTTRNQLENDPDLPVLQWIFSQFLASLPLIIFSIVAALFVFWLINRSSRKWWLWATGVFSFLVLIFLVAEPLTFKHKPLGQTPIEVRISEFAKQIGIPPDSVVLKNCTPVASCDNAHVSGLGPTRLILLNEELLQTQPESWTIQTVAHETKHFVKDDNLLGWLVLTIIFMVFFWLLDRISRAIIDRYSHRLAFDSIGQTAALPLIILILNITYLTALPPINMFRQHVEFEADRYGLELTHENRVLAEMVASWSAESKFRVPNPSLFYTLFRSSHPTDASRISFANEYQPKDKNK